MPSGPYTLPALELRRAFERARQRQKPFFLEYRRLRSRAWGPNAIVNASASTPEVHHEEDGLGGRWCKRLDSPAPCSAGEPGLLPPVGSSWMERLTLKLLLSSSYAVPPAGFPSQGVACYNR